MCVLPRRGAPHEVTWFEARRRAVFDLDPPSLHVSRRLARTIRQRRFHVTSDTAFESVIRACADPRREGAWIDASITDLFLEFYRRGLAHSVEVWREPPPGVAPDTTVDRAGRALVAGLYGLCVGAVFSAESMFSRPDLGGTDASKVALVHASCHLRRRGFALLDAQIMNPHLASLGCREITARAYLEQLLRLRDQRPDWSPFEPDRALDEPAPDRSTTPPPCP